MYFFLIQDQRILVALQRHLSKKQPEGLTCTCHDQLKVSHPVSKHSEKKKEGGFREREIKETLQYQRDDMEITRVCHSLEQQLASMSQKRIDLLKLKSEVNAHNITFHQIVHGVEPVV